MPPDSNANQAVARLQVGPNKRHISINQRHSKQGSLELLEDVGLFWRTILGTKILERT
jgi:hypothetical protein